MRSCDWPRCHLSVVYLMREGLLSYCWAHLHKVIEVRADLFAQYGYTK